LIGTLTTSRITKSSPLGDDFTVLGVLEVARKKASNETTVHDGFFSTQLQQRDRENKDKVVLGLPLQAISLRYLFCNDVFPYSRMTELVGVSESCKTAFLFEIYRWHIFNTTELKAYNPEELHGGFIHNLVEPRDSPDLRESIIRVGNYSNRYPVVQSNCVEDWQKSCSDWIKRAEEVYSEPGSMPIPVALGLDSLTAVTTRDEMDKTWDKGYAEPGFSQIAKSINMWAKVFFNKMSPWPVSFIGVNHLKENKAPNGAINRSVPGGASIKFASTFMFRLSKKDDIETLDESGRIIEIATEKNSLSPGNHPKLKVRMVWTMDKDTGEQNTVWDWHDASIELLTSFEATRKKRIMEIVQIENVDKARRTADCSSLGLKKVSWSELGQAIMQDSEIVAGLDSFLAVRKRHVFELGVPYNEQLQNVIVDSTGEDDIDA
jgi:hypothetical protein